MYSSKSDPRWWIIQKAFWISSYNYKSDTFGGEKFAIAAALDTVVVHWIGQMWNHHVAHIICCFIQNAVTSRKHTQRATKIQKKNDMKSQWTHNIRYSLHFVPSFQDSIEKVCSVQGVAKMSSAEDKKTTLKTNAHPIKFRPLFRFLLYVASSVAVRARATCGKWKSTNYVGHLNEK